MPKSIIHNADCFDVLPTLKENSIDFVCVDLPYAQTANKWDCCLDLEKMWKELERCCKDTCIYAFYTTTRFGVKLICSKEKWFRYDLVMKKINSVGWLNAKRQPLRNHELIYIFSKKSGTYNPQKTPGKPYSIVRDAGDERKTNYGMSTRSSTDNPSGDRHPLSILEFSKKSNHKSVHPTQKPLDISEWLIKSYSNEGDTVLDYTMGSGTTGVAAFNLNRHFIGIEKEQEYYDVANDRIKNVVKD